MAAGQALQLSTTSATEVEYLDDWDACSGQDAQGRDITWLHNRTGAVWSLHGVAEGDVIERSDRGDVTAELVRETLSWGDSAVYVLPNASVRLASPPDRLRWEVSLPATYTWETQQAMVDQATDWGVDVATEVATPESSVRRAAAVCGWGVFEAATSMGDLHDVDAEQVIRTGFETGSAAGDCYEVSRAASATRADGRVVSMADTLLPAVDNPRGWARINTAMKQILPYAKTAVQVWR